MKKLKEKRLIQTLYILLSVDYSHHYLGMALDSHDQEKVVM